MQQHGAGSAAAPLHCCSDLVELARVLGVQRVRAGRRVAYWWQLGCCDAGGRAAVVGKDACLCLTPCAIASFVRSLRLRNNKQVDILAAPSGEPIPLYTSLATKYNASAAVPLDLAKTLLSGQQQQQQQEQQQEQEQEQERQQPSPIPDAAGNAAVARGFKTSVPDLLRLTEFLQL